MSKPQSILDSGLQEGCDSLFANPAQGDEWQALFDADRQLVISKIGPYQRQFLRPANFTKRFFHQIYPIRIENWSYQRDTALFDGFCHVTLSVDIRFQASLEYVQRNLERIETINNHIMATYAGQVDDIVDRELVRLHDGAWVKHGLYATEQKVATAISELLLLQHIQAQCLCSVKARFHEFPEVKPGKDNVYLQVLKKSFEGREEKNLENMRQQRLQEEQALREREQHLEYLRRLTELELQAQAIEAEKNRRLLEERQDQLVQQLAIEKNLYAEQIRHQAELKALELDSELREHEKTQAKRRMAEIQQLTAQLEHEAALEQQKVLAQLEREVVPISVVTSAP